MITRIIIKRPSGGGSAPPVDHLTQDIETIQTLAPDVFLQIVKPVYKGIDCLHQDSARATPVSANGQPIGSVLNLGSLGGYSTSTGTQRPLFEGAHGGKFDGIDDQLNFTSSLLAQPLTHVLYLTEFKWNAGNSYYVDSQADSTHRHQVFSQGSTFGSFADGYLISIAPTVNRFHWLAGNTERHINRAVIIANGASSSFDMTGQFPYSTGAFNIGSTGQEGVLLGRGRVAGSAHCPMILQAYVRFPKVLTGDEIALLPSFLGE